MGASHSVGPFEARTALVGSTVVSVLGSPGIGVIHREAVIRQSLVGHPPLPSGHASSPSGAPRPCLLPIPAHCAQAFAATICADFPAALSERTWRHQHLLRRHDGPPARGAVGPPPGRRSWGYRFVWNAPTSVLEQAAATGRSQTCSETDGKPGSVSFEASVLARILGLALRWL